MIRFLADENFPGNSVRLLQERGVDLTQLSAAQQGSPDEVVIDLAAAQQRTILTFDRDFGDLIYRARYPPPSAGIVYFRAKVFSPTEPAIWLLRLLESEPTFAGYFTTLTPELTRQRPFPR